MTLAQRLLVAIGILTIATTAALGFGVRETWRRTEEQRFKEQFELVKQRLQKELRAQMVDLPALIDPVCDHDLLVDSALVGVKRGDLDARRLSLSLRVPELMKALRLEELVLVTSSGEILGAGQEGLVGKRDRKLLARMQQPALTVSRSSQVREIRSLRGYDRGSHSELWSACATAAEPLTWPPPPAATRFASASLVQRRDITGL